MKACSILLAILVVFTVEAFGQRGKRLISCGEQSACMVSGSQATFFETRNGSVPMHVVKCLVKSEKTRDKCVMDISVILETLKTNKDVVLYFGAQCATPLHLVFKNTQSTTKKNAILYLQFQGHCSVSAEDVSRWGSATDFRVFYMLKNTTWLEDNNSRLTNSSYRGLQNIGTLAFYNAKPLKFPNIFRKYVWPKMAEVSFSGLQINSIPPELNATMPLLQSLEISHNNFTKPPDFPWYNSTFHLPRGLIRTLTGNHHYQYGTIVHPKIYRRFFDLSYNNIADLSTHEFRGLLDKLTLEGNGLKVIGKSCFRRLKEIHVIDLSKNKIKQLPSELFHGLVDILHLKLDYNNISEIPGELFKSQTKIERIDLDHNKLSYIPEDLFRYLKSVEVLHLEHNQITKIDDEAFPIESSSLGKIYLQNNKINRIPGTLLLQRQGKYIDLSFNLLTFQDLVNALEELNMDTFIFQHRETASSPRLRFQESLKQINFGYNNFTTINIKEINSTTRFMFELLLKVYEIDMTGNPLLCDGKKLDLVRWIRKWMQKDPRVQPQQFSTWKCAAPVVLKDKPILSVDENQFKCLRNLTYCPKECLCFVRASDGTVIIDCNGRNLSAMPHKVPRGQMELHLQNNNIREIPPYPYLENVTALYLTHNKIERLNASTVERLQRLKIMFIDSNKLTALPRNMENLTFTTLALHHNFFKCDCTTKWMKKWLRRQKLHIENIDNVLCNSENAQGKAIYTLPDEEFVCKEEKNDHSITKSKTNDKTFKIIAFTLTGFLLLILVVFLLGYKYRGEVKVFVFTHFNWHPFDRIDDSDPNKIYDAFISYSGSDYKWVLNTLRVRLENHDPPFKLCIHDRDFLIGAPIQENILNSVDQSKRMLMVLSRNFVKSEWCLLEFRAAHRKVLEDRMNYLIIILFDDVDIAEVDDEIKLYMRTNTYLSVSNKWFWEKLVYALPQNKEKQPKAKTEMAFKNEAYEVKETVQV